MDKINDANKTKAKNTLKGNKEEKASKNLKQQNKTTAKLELNSEFKGERIAKVIARAGVCSRRDAEKLIREGKVTLNGQKVTSPALNIDSSDIVAIDGKVIAAPARTRIWRYYKPTGLITSHKDDKGRPTVFASLPPMMGRVISVGRLDLNSEGLLLLTNDGEAARFMESPKTAWRRKYKVRVHGKVTSRTLEAFAKGMDIDGIHYGKADAKLIKEQGSNAWLEITISEGKNREIRKMCESLGLQVTRLIRISYGPFQLGGLLKGEVSEVTGVAIREMLGGYFKTSPNVRIKNKIEVKK